MNSEVFLFIYLFIYFLNLINIKIVMININIFRKYNDSDQNIKTTQKLLTIKINKKIIKREIKLQCHKIFRLFDELDRMKNKLQQNLVTNNIDSHILLENE